MKLPLLKESSNDQRLSKQYKGWSGETSKQDSPKLRASQKSPKLKGGSKTLRASLKKKRGSPTKLKSKQKDGESRLRVITHLNSDYLSDENEHSLSPRKRLSSLRKSKSPLKQSLGDRKSIVKQSTKRS